MAFSCFLFGLNESPALFPSCTIVPSMQRPGRQEEHNLLDSSGKKQHFSLLLTPERTTLKGFKATCCDQVIKHKKPQPAKTIFKSKPQSKPQGKAQSKPFNWHKSPQYVKLRFFASPDTVLLIFLTSCALFLGLRNQVRQLLQLYVLQQEVLQLLRASWRT